MYDFYQLKYDLYCYDEAFKKFCKYNNEFETYAHDLLEEKPHLKSVYNLYKTDPDMFSFEVAMNFKRQNHLLFDVHRELKYSGEFHGIEDLFQQVARRIVNSSPNIPTYQSALDHVHLYFLFWRCNDFTNMERWNRELGEARATLLKEREDVPFEGQQNIDKVLEKKIPYPKLIPKTEEGFYCY